jgi:predicted Zn-dependent protease
MAAARAEVRYGDRSAGEAILRKMIADDATDWEAMLVLAQSRIVTARAQPAQRTEHMAEASRLLGAAAKLRPNDYRVYVLFGQTRSGIRGEPSENTLNALGKAVELAPQVESIRLTAASALLRRGSSEEVRVLLEPIANNPHGGPVTARAQAILASVDKNDAAAAAAAAESQGPDGEQDGEGAAP